MVGLIADAPKFFIENNTTTMKHSGSSIINFASAEKDSELGETVN